MGSIRITFNLISYAHTFILHNINFVIFRYHIQVKI